MQEQERNKIIAEFTRMRNAIMQTKGQEYHREDDILSNFKDLSMRTGATPEQVAYIYFSKAMYSIEAYITGGCTDEGSEGIENRYADAINYIEFFLLLYHERKNGNLETKQPTKQRKHSKRRNEI